MIVANVSVNQVFFCIGLVHVETCIVGVLTLRWGQISKSDKTENLKIVLFQKRLSVLPILNYYVPFPAKLRNLALSPYTIVTSEGQTLNKSALGLIQNILFDLCISRDPERSVYTFKKVLCVDLFLLFFQMP